MSSAFECHPYALNGINNNPEVDTFKESEASPQNIGELQGQIHRCGLLTFVSLARKY
jgi:hypothetical protein